MRIPTAEIVDPVTGRRKIVNADDPRVKEAAHAESQGIREEGWPQAVTRKPRRTRTKKAAE